ncbi:MAG: hypothetical protein NTZ92_08355 [Candidatus Omnitrophica bacterium]|nr:hypothetical protein [Candidatus Omnitrophota bacterium]
MRNAAEKGGIIKENPLPFFVFDAASAVEDIRGYLRNKLRRLENGVIALPTMEAADLHRFLQKVLEAPVHVARKILYWQKVEMPNDLKQTVLRCYPDIAREQERELFTKITEADSQYSEELLAQLRHPEEDQYSRTIGELKGLALDTLEFVRLNALRLT